MADFKETSLDYLNVDDKATFCSDETKWINKILKFKESYPGDVEIQHYPEDNQGMLIALVPKNWFKLTPPRKREMTDEQRAAAAERLSAARAKRNV